MYDEDILRYCHTTNIEYMTKYIVTFTIVTVKLTMVLVFGLYRESIVFPSEEHERNINHYEKKHFVWIDKINYC